MDEAARNTLNEMCPGAREAGLGDRVIDGSGGGAEVVEVPWGDSETFLPTGRVVTLRENPVRAHPPNVDLGASVPNGVLLDSPTEENEIVRVRLFASGSIEELDENEPVTPGSYVWSGDNGDIVPSSARTFGLCLSRDGAGKAQIAVRPACLLSAIFTPE